MTQREELEKRIKEEFKKCAADPVHFFRKYAIIQHPQKGKIHFDLYPFQEKTLREFQTHKYNVVLKSRQIGLSTLAAGFALWKMLFTDDYKVLVFATTQDTAKELVTKVQLMYEKLPGWLKQTAKEDVFNKLELTFKNGSSIKAVSSNEKAARSPSISLLIMDEAAFIDNFDTIFTAARATLATGGDSMILSTPNGVGGGFYNIWQDAMRGATENSLHPYNPIKLRWDVHPDRDEAWAKTEKAHLGSRKFAQEYDCDFISSGHTVVDGDILKWYMDNVTKPPMEKRYRGDLWIWKLPDYSRDYVVSADVARGDGEDFSAFHVFDVESAEQVASFKAKIGTRDYGQLLVSVATEYNNAMLVIDNKNIGWDVVQVALNCNYKNLYYSFKNDPFFDENIHIRKNIDLKNKKDMVPGFTTTHKSLMNMVSKFEIYMSEKSIIINDGRTIDECLLYVWVNGKAQAQTGANDDLVSALQMFLFVRDTALRLRQHGIELTKRALKQTHKSIYTPTRGDNNAWKMKTGGNRGDEDLRWLL